MPVRILRNRRRLSLYLVPLMLGIFGILFARGLNTPVLRGTALLLSVAGPLLAAGYILANLRTQGVERYLLIAGVMLLMLGALFVFSGVSEVLGDTKSKAYYLEDIAHWIGLCSLFIGLVALLVSVVRTDEAIEEVGARFRHLADHMGEGFMLTAADGRVALVNQRFLELTGMTEREVVGANVRYIAERLNSDVILPQIHQRLRGQTSEYRCNWVLNGEERQFHISGKPLFSRRGTLAGTLATVRDITEQQTLSRRLERYTHGLQKLVEDRTEKLRQSEERFRNLLVHMSEGFLTVDSAFRVSFANERICEVLQERPARLLDREVFQFVDNAGQGRLLELFESAQAHTERPMQQELAFVREDGTRIPVMVAVAPIQGPDDAEDSKARFSMVITDISELKRMQQQLEMRANELQAANEELQVLDRAKDGFLSNVTHELKTPLATIRGYVEMLKVGDLGALQPAQLNALGVMERNTHRLGLLIDEMIEFSRMQIRGIQLQLGLFSVRALVQDCVGSVQPQAAAREVAVEYSVEDGVSTVWADRKRLTQVLTILLSNAVKFSHPGGRVEVNVHTRADDGIALAVTDKGIGIPPAFHERVFDKFFQVDSSHTRRYEGTGIGLSIAKSIAEAHGGTIELRSAPGEGSTFTVVLQRAVFAAHRAPADVEALRGRKVVLADDEEESRRALRLVLERAGCEVVTVRSGYECARVVRETAPDLLVLSEMMPDLSGAATYRKLHDETGSPVPPAVLIQSSGTRFVTEPGVAPPYVLVKPFTPGDLVERLTQALRQEPAKPASPATPSQDGRRRPRGSVLVIDSDPDLLAWLDMGLKHRRVDCCGVTDINEALGVAERFMPDLILVDLDAANGGAPDILARLRSSGGTQDVPIYVITGRQIEYNGDLGVEGTLKKPFTINEVVEIVRGPGVQS